MQPEFDELKKAWIRFIESLGEALNGTVELLLYILNYVDERFSRMNTFDWNKAFPWIALLGVGLLAFATFRNTQNVVTPAGPWGPTPNVQPNVHPYNPNCPDCVPKTANDYYALNKLLALEASFKAERSAMRREMLRTQLNVAQAARDIGRTQPMKIPDWLYYQSLPTDSYQPGGVIGSSENKTLKWDAPPTDYPTEPFQVQASYGTPAAGK